MSSGMVDTRTVEMRFDNSDFEKNARQSMSTLEKLKSALKLDGASAGLKEVERASKKLDFRDFKNNIDGVGKKFSVLETIATGALLKIGASAAEAGIKIAKSLTVDQVAAGWDKYAEKTTAVQTIMANIRDEEGQFINDAAKMQYVNRYLNKLLWFSDETSYNFTDMTSNVGKFIANGQGLEESVTAMQGIAAWAAISGQNAQTASRAMYNISQALGTGSMKIKDWMSIENANMATAQFKELAIAVGQDKGKIEEGQVTVENFRESLSGKDTNGWFDKEVMMKVFETYGEAATRIQEYAEEHGVTSTEAIRKIKETDKEFSDSIGFKAFAAAQEAKTFGEVVSATADAVSTKWMRIFENIFGDYLQAKELWTDLSEQMWEIFAAPLDTLNEIMSKWNQGFFANGPQDILQKWFESGKMDELENGISYVTQAVADMAVAMDGSKYKIEELSDGTKQLVKLVEVSPGVYQRYTKKIYEADEILLSGREMLLQGFQNIFDTVIHDVEDENGNLESMSFFGSLKRGLQEVLFGTSEVNELVPLLSKKLWNLTKRFKDLTEKLKPSLETSLKIKNAFKGLFTIFKTGGKFIKAIAKPFTDLFSKIFKSAPKNILNLADSIGTWVQKLDQYLEENKIFDKVSNKISNGLKTLNTWVNNLSKSLTGLSVKDLGKKLRTEVFGFFENYDFKGTFASVVGYFSGIFQQIKAVNTEELPEKLTPLQNFWLGLKGIFDAMKRFFSFIAPVFKGIGEFLSNTFTSISNAFSKNEKTEKGVNKFRSVWDALREIFGGIGDFFASIGPTLSKVGGWIGNFFKTLGEGIAEWAKDKSPEEIVGSLLKGGFVYSLTNLINSIAKLARGGRIGKSLAKGLDSVKGVLKAYSREINASAIAEIGLAIALFAGSMWILDQIPADHMQKIGEVLMNLAVAVGLFALAISKLKKGKEAADSLSGKGSFLDGLKELMTATVGSSIFANDATAKFVKIALGILLAAMAAKKIVSAISEMGDVVVKLANIPLDQLKQGGVVAGQIIAAFGIFSLFAGFSNKASSALFAALGAYVLVRAISKLADFMAELGADETKMDNIQKVVDKFGYVFEAIKSMATWAIKIAAFLTLAELALAAFSTGKNANTFAMSKVMKQFGKNFMRVAGAMLIMTAALGLMSLISKNMSSDDFTALSSFFMNMVTMLMIFQVAAVGIMSFGKRSPGKIADAMKQLGKNFLRIAASLLILSAAFAAMGIVAKILTPLEFVGVAVVFTVFLAAVTLLSSVAAKVSSAKKSEYFTDNMKTIANTFLKIAGSLAIVAVAFAIMSALNISAERMIGVSAIFAIFSIIVGVFTQVAISNASIKKCEYFAKNMKAISALFLSVSFSFGIVAAAFAIMSSLNLETTEMWNIAGVFGAFAGVVAALAGLGFLIGKFGKWEAIQGIGAMALTMVSAAVSIGIVAAAFAVLANNTSPDEMAQAVEIIKWFGIIIGALALIGGLLGALGGPMAVGGMLAIAGIILSIGAACLLAGVGIGVAVAAFGLFADGLAALVTAIAEKGPEFAANIDGVLKAVLTAIRDNAPLFAEAGAAVITAVAVGIANGIKSAGEWAFGKVKSFWQKLHNSLNYEIDEHGFPVPVEPEPEIDEAAWAEARRQIDSDSADAYSAADSGKAADAGKKDADTNSDAYYEAYLAEFNQKYSQTGTATYESPTTSNPVAAKTAGEEAGKEDGEANAEGYKTGFAIGSGSLGQVGGDYGSIIELFSNITGGEGLPGLTNGSWNLSEALGIKDIDISSFKDMFGGAFEDLDFSSMLGGELGDLTSVFEQYTPDLSSASSDMASEIEKPISEIDGNVYGSEIGSGVASGIRSQIPNVSSAAYDLAQAVAQYIHFSEPDVGPLSDFHTYAPDMIRLWNKGIYDNLGSVEGSSSAMADTVYDGFSTALDYVSGLIDNGMSDQLTIRPIMDLSEIQNGMDSMNGMLAGANGYTITGTSRLAASAAYGMNTAGVVTEAPATVQTDVGPTNNNFYITNSDPNAVAEKVSKILGNQTRRQKAVWAYK